MGDEESEMQYGTAITNDYSTRSGGKTPSTISDSQKAMASGRLMFKAADCCPTRHRDADKLGAAPMEVL